MCETGGFWHTEAQHSWEQEQEEVSLSHCKKKNLKNCKTNNEAGDIQLTNKEQISEGSANWCDLAMESAGDTLGR